MLERKQSWELDKDEINHFHRAIETYDHSGGLDEVSWSIARGEYQLWSWKTDASSMVVITEVRRHPDDYRELVVLMLAGNGGLSAWVEVTTAFADQCQLFDCESVVTYVTPALWEVFKAHGAGEGVSVKYVVLEKEAT
jgi:hypothetical protein